jgi:hypothetical protein
MTVVQKSRKRAIAALGANASPSSSSTKAPADRWCSTCMSMSSRKSTDQPPAAEKEKPDVG